MIVYLTRYTTRLAVRLRTTTDGAQLTDWQQLQLIIMPRPRCWTGGSPWILTGCWPFHPTGIDVANPPLPDFPAIVMDAFDTDEEGRIVFILDKRVHELPNGRYFGLLRIHPHNVPINIAALDRQKYHDHVPWAQQGRGAAITYNRETQSNRMVPCNGERLFHKPPRPCCDLFSFDIELGPECAQHMVDQAVVEFARSTCGDIE